MIKSLLSEFRSDSMLLVGHEGIDFDLQMLRQPENVVLNDFKQQRAAALDSQLISQYEELVVEWINTIEAIVNDTADERKRFFFMLHIGNNHVCVAQYCCSASSIALIRNVCVCFCKHFVVRMTYSSGNSLGKFLGSSVVLLGSL